MAIYMTGDIHGDPSRFLELKYFCEEHENVEWIICLGDVGLNYYGKNSLKEKYIKDRAAEIPARLFCIYGNHERRPSADDGYEMIQLNSGSIRGYAWWNPQYPNQYFAVDGTAYTIYTSERTLTACVCGGAYSVDKFYRLRRGWNWWPDEQPDSIIKRNVEDVVKYMRPDIILTHTCPTRFIPTELFLGGIDQSTVDTSTEEFLDNVYNMFPADKKPMWYFGHFHGNKYTDNYVMLYEDIIELK